MPFIYAIIKSNNGDVETSNKILQEGRKYFDPTKTNYLFAAQHSKKHSVSTNFNYEQKYEDHRSRPQPLLLPYNVPNQINTINDLLRINSQFPTSFSIEKILAKGTIDKNSEKDIDENKYYHNGFYTSNLESKNDTIDKNSESDIDEIPDYHNGYHSPNQECNSISKNDKIDKRSKSGTYKSIDYHQDSPLNLKLITNSKEKLMD